MPEKNEPGWLAVIPANVRYDDRIPPNAKLLYAEITSLCKKEGYCWACNDWFAEQYKFTDRTVRALLAKLEEYGYIFIEVLNHGNNHGQHERRIYIQIDVVEVICSGRNFPSLRKRFSAASEKIFQSYNIINNNNITSVVGTVMEPECDYLPERFEKFWSYYRSLVPKGKRIGSKADARKAWNKQRPDPDTLHQMANALNEQSSTEDWRRGIGIPYVSSWINGRKWESEFGDGPGGEDAPASVGEDGDGLGWN